jgi:iron complex outermembrane receptor protein
MPGQFRQRAQRAERRLASLVCAATLLFPLAALADDLGGSRQFDIEAQALDSALIEFSEQSNLQLMVATELVRDLASPGVRGKLTAVDALLALIGSNPLTYQPVGDRTIAIVAAATTTPQASAPIDPESRPTNAGSSNPSAESLVTERGRGSSLYEDYRAVRDHIVVTGWRGKPRSIADSPAPIDVISSAAIEQSGRIGVLQSLQYLVPSFHLPTRAGGSTSTVIATGGLRGLNPDQMLVLVNGKRRHTTSLINAVALVYNGSVPADLDHIPASAIQRIEVLRDGAAAQYGSDAISGVVNIILKDGSSGGSVRVQGGQNFDRSDGEQREVMANAGFQLGRGGFVNLSAAISKRSASNRAEPIDDDYRLYYSLPDGSPDPREATIDRLVTRNYGMFPMESASIAVNASLPVAGDLEVYGFGTLSERSSILNWSFREPNNRNTVDNVYPDGFRPRLDIDESDFEFVFGARGESAGWQWDLASGLGRNHAERHASQTLNASLGPDSPTQFYVGKLESSDWVTTLDLTRGIEAGHGEVQVSWGAQHQRENYRIEAGDAASYAAGTWEFAAGHPREGQRPDPAAQANHGITPEDASRVGRDSLAAYGEIGWSPDEQLFVSLAARYEDYNDRAGNAMVGKFGARYSISPALALRFTASSGFRAPPLAQQQYASTTSQFRDLDGDDINDLLLIKQLPPETPAAVALGAVPLKPEESVNLSLGVTFVLAGGLSVTADAYRIDLDDRISITSTLAGPEVSRILAASGLPPELSGQYYTNAIDTTTEGLELVATWARDFDAGGSLAFNAGFNTNHTSIDKIAPNPPELAVLGPDLVLFDRIRRGNLTYGLPDYKAVLSVNWLFGNLDTSLRLTRFGDYRSVSNNPANEFRVDAENIVDLNLTYAIDDRWQFSLGANNLFNSYPTRIREPSERRGSGQYDTRGGFGFTGGSYFARLDFAF